VKLRRPTGRNETFYSIDRALDLFGYSPQHSRRDVGPDPARMPGQSEGVTGNSAARVAALPASAGETHRVEGRNRCGSAACDEIGYQ
jgi:hypothetical protein